MRAINWDAVNTADAKVYPIAGGYHAVIREVTDFEDREYLVIKWDYSDGPLQNYNADTYKRAKFWPASFVQSYKIKALPFFKKFKLALELSNPRYAFDEQDLQAMVGLEIGVVLGEEEYKKNNGTIGKRVYVSTVASLDDIDNRNYKIPALRVLGASSGFPTTAAEPSFDDIGDDEDFGDLPF